MSQRDYLLRAITMAIQGWLDSLRKLSGKVDQLIAEQRTAQAERTLDEATAAHLALPQVSHLARLQPGQLIQMLSAYDIAERATSYDVGKALFAAQVLEQFGDIARAEGREREASSAYTLALAALTHITTDYGTAYLSYSSMPVVRVHEKGRGNIRAEVLPALLLHYEAAGRYGKAEDALYELQDAGAEDTAREVGRAFYGRLLELDAAVLERGDFTREEAQRGLDALGGAQ